MTDRATRMTGVERWIALMLAVAARDAITATVAAELLDRVLRAATAHQVFACTYDASMFATSQLRGPLS